MLTSEIQSLNASFTELLDLFPYQTGDINGDINIGAFTDEQQSALCALLPSIDLAGHHATDTLVDLPTFHGDPAAYNAELTLGFTLSTLSSKFGMVYWNLHNSNDATKCDYDVAVSFFAIANVLDDFSNRLIY
jgi:hypothetical protein